MATVLQRLNDDASVMFDFNDGTNTYLIADVDAGTSEADSEWGIEPSEAGGVQASVTRGPVPFSFRCRITGSSYDNYVERVRNASKAFNSAGTWKWQPHGSATALYFDGYVSDFPAFLRGQELAMPNAVGMFMDPEGVPLTVMRHPLFRGAKTTLATSVAIDNTEDDMEILVTNPGNYESEAIIKVAIASSTANVARVSVGRRSFGDLTEYRGIYSFTPSTPAVTEGRWKKVWTQDINPTANSALTGTFRVVANLAFDGADEYEILLRYAYSNVDPAGSANDIRYFDTRDWESGTLAKEHDISLGTIYVPPEVDQLRLEAWTKSVAAEDITSWGVVTLVPVDEQFLSVSSPGLRNGSYAKLVYEDAAFQGTGASQQDDGTWVLNAINDRIDVEPDSGTVLGPGQHVLTLRGKVREPSKTRVKVGELQVYYDADGVGGSAATLHKQVGLFSKKGQLFAAYGEDGGPIRLRFDVNSGDTGLYIFRVTHTAATVAGRKLYINRITHGVTPVVADGRMFVVDGTTRRAYIANSSGAILHPARLRGAFPKLAPGDNVLVFRIGDYVYKGADNAAPTEPVLHHLPARAGTATVECVPRYTH